MLRPFPLSRIRSVFTRPLPSPAICGVQTGSQSARVGLKSLLRRGQVRLHVFQDLPHVGLESAVPRDLAAGAIADVRQHVEWLAEVAHLQFVQAQRLAVCIEHDELVVVANLRSIRRSDQLGDEVLACLYDPSFLADFEPGPTAFGSGPPSFQPGALKVLPPVGEQPLPGRRAASPRRISALPQCFVLNHDIADHGNAERGEVKLAFGCEAGVAVRIPKS